MVIILKQRRLSRSGALKSLDYATQGQPAACEKLIDMGGLPPLFAIFMGRGKVKRKGSTSEEASDQQQAEERAVSVVANLLMVSSHTHLLLPILGSGAMLFNISIAQIIQITQIAIKIINDSFISVFHAPCIIPCRDLINTEAVTVTKSFIVADLYGMQ